MGRNEEFAHMMPPKIYWLLAKYAWAYLKISLHSMTVWGAPSDVENNDKRLSNLYPKEWKYLESIRKEAETICLAKDGKK